MTNPELLLKLDSVSKIYEASAEYHHAISVLDNINFELKTGEAVAIVGPSGSGKSTLLNIAGGIDRPTCGRVLFQGREITLLNDDELAMFRNRQIGLIFQDHHLLPQCSVLENVLLPTIVPGNPLSTADAETNADRLLARAGLTDRHHHRPAQLSGGERQRVAVVRALVNGPRLVLADEPTGALDRTTAAKVFDLLLEMNREEDMSLVVVTHSLEFAQKMDRIYELINGELVNLGEGLN